MTNFTFKPLTVTLFTVKWGEDQSRGTFEGIAHLSAPSYGLIMFACGMFFGYQGYESFKTGKPTMVGVHPVSDLESFGYSAASFVLAIALVGVALGLVKSSRENSD